MDLTHADKDKPLRNKLLYLDLKLSKKQDVTAFIRDLRSLGGEIEEFLSKEVNYVVTDRPNWKRDAKSLDSWAPDTPNSTQSPFAFSKCEIGELYSNLGEADGKRNQQQTSRGQKLLQQATKHHKRHGSTDVLEISRYWGIRILPLSTVLKWLEKCKKTAVKMAQKRKLSTKTHDSVGVTGIKRLVSPFIKVEDKQGCYRTFYKEFTTWPNISPVSSNLKNGEEQAKLRENVQRIDAKRKMLKPDPKSEGFSAKMRDICKKKCIKENKEPKRMAYCEICATSFTNLEQHMTTKLHRSFLSERRHFFKLNEVVFSLPPVDYILSENFNPHASNLSNLSENNKKRLKVSASDDRTKRKHVVANLSRRFDLCPLVHFDKKHSANSVEEERIEGSCNTPPHQGFRFLEDAEVIENSMVYCGIEISSSEDELVLDKTVNGSSFPHLISCHSPDAVTSAIVISSTVTVPNSETGSTNDTTCAKVPLVENGNINSTQDVSLVTEPLLPVNAISHAAEETMKSSEGCERIIQINLENQSRVKDGRSGFIEPEYCVGKFNHLNVPNYVDSVLNSSSAIKSENTLEVETNPKGLEETEVLVSSSSEKNKEMRVSEESFSSDSEECFPEQKDCAECKVELQPLDLGDNCVECKVELQPLNLCTRDDSADNQEQTKNSEPFPRAEVPLVADNCQHENKMPRKVFILTDRSMHTFFDSKDDDSEFLGFKPGESKDNSDLSYVEATCPTDLFSSRDLTFKNSENTNTTETDDEWDSSIVEYIDRQVPEKPQIDSSPVNKQPLETLQTSTSSNGIENECSYGNIVLPHVSVVLKRIVVK